MFRAPIRDGLELRLHEPHYAPQLLAAVDANREHLMEWLPWPPLHTKIDDTLEFIGRAMKGWGNGESVQCGIWEGDRIVGGLGTHAIDTTNKNSSIGYWLAADAQGRGIMTGACGVLLDYLFDQRGLHRVWLEAAEGNTRSRAVAERLGFINEGTARDSHLIHGHWLSMVEYGILEDEWRAHRESLRR